ncbi:AAA ATPase AAA+ lid [Gracilaria domingensis]|nr:AAA ATPase AAA+ lid [Gracilaria domingensis]
MTQDASSPPAAKSLVLRLTWESRAARTASAALLRDYFLRSELPPPATPYELPFLPRTFSVIVVRCEPGDALHTTDDTKTYLLPPIPPSLNSPFSLDVDTSPPLHAMLRRALAMEPFSPRAILLLSDPGGGKSSVAAHAVWRCGATYIRLQPTHLSVSEAPALLKSLMYYAYAAIAASPSVLVIDDAHLTFAPLLNRYAAIFLAFRHSLRDMAGVVLLLLANSRSDLHPNVVGACDLVLSLPSRVTREQRPKVDKQRMAKSWQQVRSVLPGAEEAEKYLKRLLYHPIVLSERLRKLGVRTPSALLLYGAPGTGKTSLVREAASATNTRIIPLQAAELARGAVGESERLLRFHFEQAAADPPALIFLDEIDALFAPSMKRLPAVLGTILDKLSSGVKVVAATNAPWMVAKSLLRPGRIDRCVLVPLPNSEGRRQIGIVFAKRMNLKERVAEQVCVRAEKSEGFTGADIQGACRRAALNALSDNRDIEMQDVNIGFDAVQASVDKTAARKIADWSVS